MTEARWSDAELEAALRAASPAWPATPDLATRIGPRLAPRRRRRWRAWLTGGLAGAVVATLAIEPARSTVFEFLGLQSVRIERRAPDPSPRPFDAGLDLGRPATLGRASRAIGLAVTPPRTLDKADGIWLRESPGALSLVYRRPRVLVQVLDARIEAPVIQKSAGGGVRVEPVGGGYFLSGAPHAVGYVARDGTPVVEPQRLAGNTLLVERDGALIRVEGRLSRRRALEIVDSMNVRRLRSGG